MCDKCEATGSWDILEKFLSMQKSNKDLKEHNILKTDYPLKKSFSETWKCVTNDCQSIKDLPTEEYNILLDRFSLPVIN